MEQLKGCSSSGQEKKVCNLVKSLYGLKQAPKQWHEKFDNVMMSHDFKINECDSVFMSKILKVISLYVCIKRHVYCW